jgi:hypothetical protein
MNSCHALVLLGAVLVLMAVPGACQCYCDVSDSVTYPGTERVDCSDNSLYEVPDDCIANSANISELILSRNLLTNIKSTTLAELTELRSLYLDYNDLSFVDVTSFEFMTKLEVLSLDHNLQLHLEPATFATLASLTRLTTIGTNLVYLPDISSCAKLNWVDLRSSALVSLPLQLFSDQLTTTSMYVSVQGNEFPDASVVSFRSLPNNTILHVDTELTFWAHDAAERDAFVVKPWDVNVNLAQKTKICEIDGLPGDLSICF